MPATAKGTSTGCKNTSTRITSQIRKTATAPIETMENPVTAPHNTLR